MPSAVTVSDVRHSYGRTQVLAGVDLRVQDGEHVAVTGPSGAGKSTLLALLGGLERLQSGTIAVGQADLARLGGRELARYRRRTVGFVFQHFGLLDTLTARENVELAMAFAGVSGRERGQRALRLLESVGLADRTDHLPAELSGGERQRVALARALANRPALVLADEPTGNLDDDSASRVLDVLEELRREAGFTMLVVTHDPEVARRADREVHLSRGLLSEVARA
jgi:putative ABC transport system ATP-binding protein